MDKKKFYKFDRSAYNAEWQKDNMKAYTFRLNVRTDADVIKKLESVPNKRKYFIDLIRNDK